MMKSLYVKLAAGLCALFFLTGIFIIILTQYAFNMNQQEVVQTLNRNLAKNIVAQNVLISDGNVDQKALEECIRSLMMLNPSIEIYLLDPMGTILAYSAPPGKVKETRVDLTPIKNWFRRDISSPLKGDDPRNPDRQKIFTAARIVDQSGLQGYLYIILGGETYDKIAQGLEGSYALKMGFWWITAGLLFFLMSGLVLFAYLTSRLKGLAALVDSYDVESVSDRLPARLADVRPQGDEIERIAYTFKQLVLRIQSYVFKLKETHARRRELIANISHDLRAPLTNLMGYIESLLLRDAHLTDEKRREYVELAFEHCTRLSKLIDALLELATLGSAEIQVNFEPFNINEMVHDVVQKLELSAQNKDVAMNVATNPQLPFVNADIALVERVIENLLDNALRFTPAGGAIDVSFSQNGSDITVCVKDTGCGIPAEDQQFIFEPYYKKGTAQQRQSGISGLGLAIVRQILELHNKSIRVESSPGCGAQFSFELPIHQPS
jgi:signal transduction histidine kinase